ncbi:MAG TPA: 3-isopropylmalate dehydrogenase [Ktedonobacterales bacterium]|nr:3-isopropylmalate dehydrogenase [Ktedonobacterales bacterium]
MAAYTIAVLGGDGIGPEVTAEAARALTLAVERAGHSVTLHAALVGQAAIEREGSAISDETLALCQRSDAVLFGAVGGVGVGRPDSKQQPEQALFSLRKELELFANLRPVRPLPALAQASTLKREVLRDVDLLIVRELTGGLYYGKPSEIREGEGEDGKGASAIDTMVYSEAEIERIVRYAFTLAQGRRKLVTSVDKANVLSCSRLWRRVADRVQADFPDVELRHLLVDSCAMALIRQPRDFDVIVTENMFGDILTDEASMLTGSMGMLPSASLGARHTRYGQFGLYEPIHGTAPDITGQGKANPLAAILSAALLLRYSLGMKRAAQSLEAAVRRVIVQGYRTVDIARKGATGERVVSTREMGEAVLETLRGAQPASTLA